MIGLTRILSHRGVMASAMLLLLAVFAATTVQAKTVSDPNHKGWTGKHPRSKMVEWKPIKVKCEKCTKMADQYNAAAQQLLNSRYWVNFWREVQKNREKGKKDPFWPGKGDINEFEGKAVGANLELMESQNAQLELHKKMVRQLEQQLSYLRAAIQECERSQCQAKKPSKMKGIEIGGQTTKTAYSPDAIAIMKQYGIDWKGPYQTNCRPCLRYVQELNALPGWVVKAHMRLQVAENMLEYARLVNKSNKVKLDFLQYTHPDKTDYSGLEQQIENIKLELETYKNYFGTLLQKRQDCEQKMCLPKISENIGYLPITACPAPSAEKAITVGANNEVGSKANFKEKAKKKTAGLATKAITGLLGIGGSRGGNSEGPGTYKDPVKKKQKLRIRSKNPKREILTGAVFTTDGLLVSTDIKRAPGKGTFQTIYLENQRGWRLAPIALFMYEIWKDWKLSVSWTRDTYIDGEHVSHEEGGWTESWRELVARGEEVIYGAVQDTPMWQQLGFNTAVSGAKSLGTLFPVSPEMLAAEPINLVIHVTQPKADPVITLPYIFELSLDKKGQIKVVQVDKTAAASGPPCV